MPLFPKRTTEDKLSEAKQGFWVGILLVIAGGIGWAVVLQVTNDIWWPAIIFFFMVISGAYILWQSLLGLVIDFTVGRSAFILVCTFLVVGGLLVHIYELLTTP
jgi:hypothetical protein